MKSRERTVKRTVQRKFRQDRTNRWLLARRKLLWLSQLRVLSHSLPGERSCENERVKVTKSGGVTRKQMTAPKDVEKELEGWGVSSFCFISRQSERRESMVKWETMHREGGERGMTTEETVEIERRGKRSGAHTLIRAFRINLHVKAHSHWSD